MGSCEEASYSLVDKTSLVNFLGIWLDPRFDCLIDFLLLLFDFIATLSLWSAPEHST